MHDIAYANMVLEALKREIRSHDAAKIIIVNVSLSQFSHVSEDSLKQACKLLLEKEGIRNAEILIKKKGVSIICGECGVVTEVFEPTFACPACGKAEFDIDKGEEFKVNSVEIRK